MGIVVLDMETYYDVGYTLKAMSTEEYVRDPRFEVILCGISINGKPAQWYPQPDIPAALAAIDWSSNSLLCYNTAFDGAILGWKYGHYPALYLDAMGMAKACNRTYRGGSLRDVLTLMNLRPKGTYVEQAKGKHYADFAPHELAAYGEYCCTDVDATADIYRVLRGEFPASEVRVQDLNLRLFIEPLLTFNSAALQVYRDDVIAQKQEKLNHAAKLLSLDWVQPGQMESALRSRLASNPQFADVLQQLGVDPPTKLSAKTGKETWAFAKTDTDFVALLEHEDPAVQAVMAARLGVKSTIEETRAERFIDIATRGAWPVEYKYCGANTTRFSGAGKANPQNLKRGGKLRDAIEPPPGHLIIAPDLGQIECRVLNYLAGQENILQAFAAHDAGEGPDVYCILAEQIYRRAVTPGMSERMVGKVGELSLGYGAGWKAFKSMLFVQAKGMVIRQSESQAVVDSYRRSHGRVEALWGQGDAALSAMLRGQEFSLGREGILKGTPDGIVLPSGLRLAYPELKQKADDKGRIQFCYTNRKKDVFTHGAVIVQNVTEALSRLILTDAWLRLANRVRIVMTTHDELVAVVPFAQVEWAMETMVEEMTRPVVWAPGLPLACEVKAGRTYGEAKR